MTKILTLLTFLSLITFGLKAEKFTKASSSNINFKIKNLGSYVNGSFKSVDIVAVFDTENTDNISLKGVAKVSSVSTGNSLRDKHLEEKSDFFNGAKYPTVTMKSYKVEKLSDTKYKVYWKITMRGVTKNLSTTVTATPSNGGMKLSSKFKVDRNLWDLGGNGLKMVTVGDDVIINISTILK